MPDEKLSEKLLLDLRREAVARAETAFKGSTERGARHYARLQLTRNRRALQTLQENLDAAH